MLDTGDGRFDVVKLLRHLLATSRGLLRAFGPGGEVNLVLLQFLVDIGLHRGGDVGARQQL